MKQFLYFFLLSVLTFGAVASCEAPAASEDIAVNEAGEPLILTGQVPSGQDTIVITQTPTGENLANWLAWIWENLKSFAAMLMILIAFYEPIARITPTEKDNNFLRMLQSWLDAIPFLQNRKKGGGTFTAYRDHYDAPKAGYVPRKKE